LKKILKSENFQIILVLIITLIVLFRVQLLNNFSQLSGDFIYDNIIHTTILEHWFNVFRGRNYWSEVGYFYPYKNTIAQTDAYFLIGVIYSFFRIFNIDPFLSTEYSNIALKLIGFIASYYLSKKIINNHYFSLILAITFTLNNASTIHIYRIQLNSVAFIPILVIMVIKCLESLNSDEKNKFLIYYSSFGLLLGSLAMTSFYITFFFLLFIAVFAVTLTVFNRSDLLMYLRKIISNLSHFVLGTLVTFIAFLPFIFTFLPKSFETGVKQYPYFALIDIPGLVQMGKGNLIWGYLYEKFLSTFFANYKVNYSSEYYNMGFSPIILFLLLISFFWLYKKSKLIFSLLLAVLISISLIIIINGFSLWQFVYRYVYGAKALTVVSIFTIVLALPILIVIVFYLSHKKKNFITYIILPVLLISFELNNSVYKLNRNEELSKYDKFIFPEIKCNSFFVGGWQGQEVFGNYWEWINNQYAHNVSAMYISQKLNIPTINGMASFIPKTYNLVGPNGTAFSPHSEEYLNRVKQYIKKNKLKKVCYLNLNTQTFERVNYK